MNDKTGVEELIRRSYETLKTGDAAAAFDRYGRGAIVNNSRGIICAWQKAGTDDYASAAREAAIEMRDALRKHVTMV